MPVWHGHGMAITDESGASVPIMKPTRWLSSSIQMLRRLSSKCKNEHKHGSLLNGKAAQAAIYPQKLCVEILKGFRDTTIEEDLEKEMKDESENQNMINSLVYNCHPWEGCTQRFGIVPDCGAPNPGTKGSGPNGGYCKYEQLPARRRPEVLRRSDARRVARQTRQRGQG